MYKMICFPHYTCGGLLCDILNNTWSDIGSRGDIKNVMHSVGKIGDVDTVLTEYNIEDLLLQIKRKNVTDKWIGTHCWPNHELIQNCDNIILVSTSTFRSRLYRWARVYHHYFRPQWENFQGIDLIDKIRETAKNYLVPFSPVYHANVINLEFSDVVENTPEFQYVVNYTDTEHHLKRWRKVNSFLYKKNFWNSDIANSFHQAEYEVNLNRYYKYT